MGKFEHWGLEGNLRVEHAKGPPFSSNQRTTTQLPTLKNVPQEMETTPSGGRSAAQTEVAGQFDDNKETDVVETQQAEPENSTHDWWEGRSNKLDAENDEDLENSAND